MRNTEKCLKDMWAIVKYIYVMEFPGEEEKLKQYLGTELMSEEIPVKKFPKLMKHTNWNRIKELCLL